MDWAKGAPSAAVMKPNSPEAAAAVQQEDDLSLERNEDYEAATLLRLKQAQERKRLKEEQGQTDENTQ